MTDKRAKELDSILHYLKQSKEKSIDIETWDEVCTFLKIEPDDKEFLLHRLKIDGHIKLYQEFENESPEVELSDTGKSFMATSSYRSKFSKETYNYKKSKRNRVIVRALSIITLIVAIYVAYIRTLNYRLEKEKNNRVTIEIDSLKEVNSNITIEIDSLKEVNTKIMLELQQKKNDSDSLLNKLRLSQHK